MSDTNTGLTPDDLEIGDRLTNITEKPARGPDARTYEVVGFEHGKGFGGDETDTIVQHPEGREENVVERKLAKHWELVEAGN